MSCEFNRSILQVDRLIADIPSLIFEFDMCNLFKYLILDYRRMLIFDNDMNNCLKIFRIQSILNNITKSN